MAQNIVVGIFEVESEGFQALTELKQEPRVEKSLISQAALVKKEDGAVKVLDWFDTGADTLNDTAAGGLIGAALGVIGGPLGMLFFGSYGALVGSVLDTGDALDEASIIEQIAKKMFDDEVVLIALADEEDEAILDGKLSKFKTTIIRYDAAVVAEEVAEARLVEADLARQARAQLRREKTDDFKAKVEDARAKIREQFASLKESLA